MITVTVMFSFFNIVILFYKLNVSTGSCFNLSFSMSNPFILYYHCTKFELITAQ